MMKLEYHNYWFLIRGGCRPISLDFKAISLDAARADIYAAYGDDVEIITCGRY